MSTKGITAEKAASTRHIMRESTKRVTHYDHPCLQPYLRYHAPQLHTFTCTHTHKHTHTYLYIHTHPHPHTHIYTHTHTSTFTTHIYTHTHIYIHHTHTHTHTHLQPCWFSLNKKRTQELSSSHRLVLSLNAPPLSQGPNHACAKP
jgi:hypothetical protein